MPGEETTIAEKGISVCIPTYNRGNLLPGAIDSALAQLGESDELLVVDNHSEDDTQTVLGRYADARMRVVRNGATVSMYENHNRCVAEARGKWILFLHSDDALEPGAMDACRRHVRERPTTACFHPKEEQRRAPLPLTLTGPTGLAVLFRMRNGTPSGKIFSREWLTRVPFPGEPLTADQLLLGRLLAAGGTIERIPEKIVQVNEGEFQATGEWLASGQAVRDFAVVYNEMIDYPGVLEAIAAGISTWTDDEIADCLLFLAHGGRGDEIAFLEKQLVGQRSYRRRKGYRHVGIYKKLGLAGLRLTFGAVKIAKRMMKPRGRKKASSIAGEKPDSRDNPLPRTTLPPGSATDARRPTNEGSEA